MAWPFSAGETVLVITTLGTALVSVLTVFKQGSLQAQQGTIVAKVDTVEGKVDTVHDLTNSRLSRIEGELTATRAELASTLQALHQAEQTRATLASEAARVVEKAGEQNLAITDELHHAREMAGQRSLIEKPR